MKTVRPFATMMLGCAALLGLTSCTAGGPTYDFSPQQIEPAKSLTITVSDDLRKAVTGESGQLIVNSYEVTGREIAGAELCAYDVTINYADGGLETIKDAIKVPSDEQLITESRNILIEAMGVSSWETAAEEFVAASEEIAHAGHEYYTQYYSKEEQRAFDIWGPNSFMTEESAAKAQISFEDYLEEAGFDSLEHFAAERYVGHPDLPVYDYNSDPDITIAVVGVSEFRSSLRSDLAPRERVEGGSMQDHLDRTDELIAKDIEANRQPPERLFGMDMHFYSNTMPLADLDEAAPEEGLYVAEDFRKLTRVTSCAVIPQDSENYSELPMNWSDSEKGIGTFATARVMVMKDGTVWTVGEVEGFIQDSNGNWVRG